MKANEFVKKFGWDKAKGVASFTSNVCADPTHFDSDLDIYAHFDDFKGVMDESDVCIEDLKRLVESHDLVESYGGLENAKGKLEYFDWIPTGSWNHARLSKAIADVEACEGVS